MLHHHWERQRRLGRGLRELRTGGRIQAGEKEVSKRTGEGWGSQCGVIGLEGERREN